MDVDYSDTIRGTAMKLRVSNLPFLLAAPYKALGERFRYQEQFGFDNFAALVHNEVDAALIPSSYILNERILTLPYGLSFEVSGLGIERDCLQTSGVYIAPSVEVDEHHLQQVLALQGLRLAVFRELRPERCSVDIHHEANLPLPTISQSFSWALRAGLEEDQQHELIGALAQCLRTSRFYLREEAERRGRDKREVEHQVETSVQYIMGTTVSNASNEGSLAAKAFRAYTTKQRRSWETESIWEFGSKHALKWNGRREAGLATTITAEELAYGTKEAGSLGYSRIVLPARVVHDASLEYLLVLLQGYLSTNQATVLEIDASVLERVASNSLVSKFAVLEQLPRQPCISITFQASTLSGSVLETAVQARYLDIPIVLEIELLSREFEAELHVLSKLSALCGGISMLRLLFAESLTGKEMQDVLERTAEARLVLGGTSMIAFPAHASTGFAAELAASFGADILFTHNSVAPARHSVPV